MKNTTLCYLEVVGCWLLLLRIKMYFDPFLELWIGIGGNFVE